jgi:nucleotide sugar dehydrogenase
MKITVVGLGKIGLPLAVQFASRGHHVLGADVSAPTVATVNSGREPFPGEAYLQEKLADVVARDLLKATTDTAAAASESDVVVVVVPLFVDAEGIPDFGWMDAATGDIAGGLKPGTLVVCETTLPVGTTRTCWKPMLQDGSGLTAGKDFQLVFSPERVLTGRVFADPRKYPKLVGGLSDEEAKRAIAFYEDVLEFEVS